MSEIGKRMEDLRNQLNKLIENKDSCVGEKVLELSCELDKVINEYIQIEKANWER